MVEMGSAAQHYLSDLPKRRRRRRVILWLISLGILLWLFVFGMFWILFQSPFFRIQEVRVEGNSTVAEADIRGVIDRAIFHQKGWRGIFPVVSRIFSWPDRLTDSDLAFLPRLKEVVIQKNYPARRIAVRVVEREPLGIWCFAGNAQVAVAATSTGPHAPFECGWFDREGVLFERAPRAEGSLIQSVDDYSGSAFHLRSTVLPSEFMAPFFSVLQVIRASGVSAKEIRVEDLELAELKVKTYEGPELYFSLRFPADFALPALQSLFTPSTSSVPFANLNYVDFRVEHRAYYK